MALMTLYPIGSLHVDVELQVLPGLRLKSRAVAGPDAGGGGRRRASVRSPLSAAGMYSMRIVNRLYRVHYPCAALSLERDGPTVCYSFELVVC